MNTLVCRQAQHGSTAASIAIFASVLVWVLVFGWSFGGEPAAPVARKREWWLPRPSTPKTGEVDGMRHLSQRAPAETNKPEPGRLETGDEEFSESRILELMKPSNVTFAPCTKWNAFRLREAYLKIVPNFHNTNKDSSIKEEQVTRWKSLHNACEAAPKRNARMTPAQRKILHQHLLVDDKHKLLYCYVPKVGCSNWKKVLKVLSGRDAWPGCLPFNHATDPVPLSSYTNEEKVHRLKHYYKFMFVRDPLDRLVSAYMDKFTPNGTERSYYMYKYYGKQIVSTYRSPKPTNLTLVQGDDVTWEEFIEYVINLKKDVHFNEHWMPYETLCQPCLIDYDFVGQYEQMSDEANYVLRQVQADDVVAYPGRQGYYHTSSRDKVMSLFRTLNASTQQRVLDIYGGGYRMFGYQKPTVEML